MQHHGPEIIYLTASVGSVPMMAMAATERFTVPSETLAKLAAGGSLSEHEMLQFTGQLAPTVPEVVAPVTPPAAGDVESVAP